ncbi:hypothetical protein HBB16_08380 [Pseudonocardia sp. MCCB 268]|nr:hypothetical protein [Pseudonocardia cytotoxica]
MSSHGIRTKVAIVGMGCTRFGELWDRSAGDLVVESTQAALTSPASPGSIDAYWLGTLISGIRA